MKNLISTNRMEVMSYIGIFIATIFTIWVSNWIHRWRNPKCKGILPPGSMGFPILGETAQFFRPHTTFDVSPFIKERQKRFGPIFKTNLLGQPVVAVTDPQLVYFVLNQEEKLFESCYPASFANVVGPNNVGSSHGFMHKYLASLVRRQFGPDTVKSVLFSEIHESCHATLKSWSNQPGFELQEALADMIFEVSAKRLISYEPSSSVENNLRRCFVDFIENLFSFPINIPGMAYHKCLQGKKRATKVLKRMLTERMSTTNKQSEDFFDIVIAELKEEKSPMTEKTALNLIFVLLFVSYETTSLTLTLIVKFLSDNPRVLHELTDEHERIVRKRNDPDSGVTWEEYKSMTFTSQVINESLRLANIAPVLFRKCLQDVEIGGYTLPKGWRVILSLPSVHLNSEIYEDPFVFNPWRWKDKQEITGGTKQLLAFGAGLRYCVGANFSQVFMSIFLHNFVTKCRWNVLRGGNILRNPGLKFPDGFYIQVFPKE